MYPVTDSYKEKIISDVREFAVRVTFDGTTVLTGTTIQNIALEELTNSGDALTMGSACSSKVVINLINPPPNIDYDNSPLIVEVGVGEEYIPLGKFYATTPETSNDFKNLQLTAYDGFCKMTGKYNATVNAETTLQAVYDDLKAQLYENCGITLKERVCPSYTISNFPYLDITYTQAIGYVAGCLGGFARFDRTGELEIAWYTDSEQTIPPTLQYMGGFKRTTSKSLTVTSIATGTEENPIVKGNGVNGTQINFENPYITDEMAEDIYASVNGLTYTPCNVKWRGNPAIQAGDIVQVLDKDGGTHVVLVMSHSLKVGSGCNATIECKGTGETESEFSGRFESVGKKIERVYANFENAILNATNAITGNSGGYVKIHDTNGDGKPDEILIMDSENMDLATKVWRWNKEGLGYAYNAAGGAYAGPYATAITADGQIVANFITTGTLSAERISVENFDADNPTVITDYIRFGEGTMTFGKGDSAITLKLENNQVAFYGGDTRIAYFSNNSFEIENMTNGMMRLQNFGFLFRTSGNLTFTKVK